MRARVEWEGRVGGDTNCCATADDIRTMSTMSITSDPHIIMQTGMGSRMQWKHRAKALSKPGMQWKHKQGLRALPAA